MVHSVGLRISRRHPSTRPFHDLHGGSTGSPSSQPGYGEKHQQRFIRIYSCRDIFSVSLSRVGSGRPFHRESLGARVSSVHLLDIS